MSRKITVFADAPARGRRFAIVPYGVYLHKDIACAKRGDTVVFDEGWRLVRMEYIRGCPVKVDSPVFVFLLRSIYGEGISVSGFFSRWTGVCINEGFGKNGFSRDEVMLIEVKEIEK